MAMYIKASHSYGFAIANTYEWVLYDRSGIFKADSNAIAMCGVVSVRSSFPYHQLFKIAESPSTPPKR
jgi:hypothetical protein